MASASTWPTAWSRTCSCPTNPQRFPVTPDMSPREAFGCYDHRYDLDQAGNTAIYRRWRGIAERYDALLLGEVYLRDNNPDRVSRYVANQDGLHRAFYFAPMHTPWDRSAMWSTFRDALDAAPRDLSWAVSSHDDPRAPTRLGGGEQGQSSGVGLLRLVVRPSRSAVPLPGRRAGIGRCGRAPRPVPRSGGHPQSEPGRRSGRLPHTHAVVTGACRRVHRRRQSRGCQWAGPTPRPWRPSATTRAPSCTSTGNSWPCAATSKTSTPAIWNG